MKLVGPPLCWICNRKFYANVFVVKEIDGTKRFVHKTCGEKGFPAGYHSKQEFYANDFKPLTPKERRMKTR